VSKTSRLIVGERHNERKAHLDLTYFLYKGGANLHRPEAERRLLARTLGRRIARRIPFVNACYQVMSDRWEDSASFASMESDYSALSAFFEFSDGRDIDVTPDNAKETFLAWRRDLSGGRTDGDLASGAYSNLSKAGRIIALALGTHTRDFLASCNVFKPSGGFEAKKQIDLLKAPPMVADLKNIVTSLTPQTIFGRLPLAIKFTAPDETYEHYSGLWSAEKFTKDRKYRDRWEERITQERRESSLEDTSIYRRFPLINLRCSAEFLLFVAGSGMNMAQVIKLPLLDYRFQLFDDQYQVSGFKVRGEVEVEFAILRDYKPYFESWLKFRREMYPEDSLSHSQHSLLFPTIVMAKPNSSKFNYFNVRDLLQKMGRSFVPPQDLRQVKANFFARTSDGREVEPVALQHSQKTFARHYDKTAHPKASRELTAYFKTIPNSKLLLLSAIKGSCSSGGAPEKLEIQDESAPEPDCLNPSGCLFCKNHKGISSLDYVWGLLSFRELKSDELSSYKRAASELVAEIETVLERIQQLLDAFSSQNKKQREWHELAYEKIRSGNYHPRWRGFILMTRSLA
jgi:hypothetical protein